MPTWMSCPTFSSTDIFFTRFSANSQEFLDGANTACWGLRGNLPPRRRVAEKARLASRATATIALDRDFIFRIRDYQTCDKGNQERRRTADEGVPGPRYHWSRDDFIGCEKDISHQQNADKHSDQRVNFARAFEKGPYQK